VGGLRFVVHRVGPSDYSARAVDQKGHGYEIYTEDGRIVLSDRTGELTEHESLDAAESEAGRVNRRQYPLKVPKFKWTKHTWRERRFDKGYNTHDTLIAPACEVPFLGTGHFTSGRSAATTTKELGWVGAGGEWGRGTADIPALATACGIVDPYGARGAGAYWHATKAQVADVYRVLIKAANKGRKLYRVFPMLPAQAQFLPGSLRQVVSWDAWLASARNSYDWQRFLRSGKKDRADSDPAWRNQGQAMMDYDFVGEALFLPREILAELKSGKLRFGKLETYEKEHAGIKDPSGRARSVGTSVVAPNRYRSLQFDPYIVEHTLRGGKMQDVAHALVEIVEYNDGDKPYVKSLGYFRSLTHEELDIKWGNIRDKKLTVKPYPGTWLTRVDLDAPRPLPATAELSQMEFGFRSHG
jgi:hypothetical protein